jgi:hypothetical protein
MSGDTQMASVQQVEVATVQGRPSIQIQREHVSQIQRERPDVDHGGGNSSASTSLAKREC